VKRRQNIQLAEELKKIRLGVDDVVDHLDMLIQHFAVVDIDGEDEEKGEEVSNKNILLE
jgi:hypothetical protein